MKYTALIVYSIDNEIQSGSFTFGDINEYLAELSKTFTCKFQQTNNKIYASSEELEQEQFIGKSEYSKENLVNIFQTTVEVFLGEEKENSIKIFIVNDEHELSTSGFTDFEDLF